MMKGKRILIKSMKIEEKIEMNCNDCEVINIGNSRTKEN